MKLTKSKDFNEGHRIFYKHGAWYGYCEYKQHISSNTIRRYNDDLTTYGYLVIEHTKICDKIFYI